MLLAPELLQKVLNSRMERYKRLYELRKAEESVPCLCHKVVQKPCRRCQRILGLSSQMVVMFHEPTPEEVASLD